MFAVQPTGAARASSVQICITNENFLGDDPSKAYSMRLRRPSSPGWWAALIVMVLVGGHWMEQPQRPISLASTLTSVGGHTQVSMGSHGYRDGLNPIPPVPPPSYNLGGTHWIYERDYGKGRPKTSVWADCDTPEECAKLRKKKPSPPTPPPPPPPPPPAPVVKPTAEPSPPPIPTPSAPAPAPPPAATPPPRAPAAVPPAPPAEGREATPAAEPPAPAPPSAEAPAPAPAADTSSHDGKSGGGCMGPPCLLIPQPNYEYTGFPKLPVGGGGIVPSTYAAYPTAAPYPAAAPPAIATAPPIQQLPVSTYSPLLPAGWSEEDAAEHSFNLAQWRTQIMRARLGQASLRKQIMAVTSGVLPTSPAKREAGGMSSSTLKAANALKAMKGELAEVAKDTAASLSSLRQSVASLEKERQVSSSKHGYDEGRGRFHGEALARFEGVDASRRGRWERVDQDRGGGGGLLRREYERVGEEEGRRWEQRREVRREKAGMEKRREEMRHVQRQLKTLLRTADAAIASRLAERKKQQAPTMARGSADRHLARTKRMMEASLKGLLHKVDSAIEVKEAQMGKGAAKQSLAQMQAGEGKIDAIEQGKGQGDSKIKRIEAVKRGADAQLNLLLSKVEAAEKAQKEVVSMATAPGRVIFRTR